MAHRPAPTIRAHALAMKTYTKFAYEELGGVRFASAVPGLVRLKAYANWLSEGFASTNAPRAAIRTFIKARLFELRVAWKYTHSTVISGQDTRDAQKYVNSREFYEYLNEETA